MLTEEGLATSFGLGKMPATEKKRTPTAMRTEMGETSSPARSRGCRRRGKRGGDHCNIN